MMPDQDLADDPAADRAQAVAVVQDLGLLEDVEPQRRLAGPAVLGEARPARRSAARTPRRRATASPEASPTAWPRCRSRLASDA